MKVHRRVSSERLFVLVQAGMRCVRRAARAILLAVGASVVISSSSAATLPPGFMETIIPDTWDDFAGITFDEVGAVYAWDRVGRVWLIENDRRVLTPVVDISEEVGSWNDHGLLGVAFHPNFRQNGYIYLLYVVDAHHLFHFGTPDYNANSNDFRSATIGRITRYTARASDNFRTVDPASRLVLLGNSPTNGMPITYITHGVGSLVFGSDGSLLASCGDGASLSDHGDDDTSYAAEALNRGILRPKENVGAFRSQMVDSFNGKILRLSPDTGEGLPSNPFYDASAPRSPRSLVYALGLRNGFRFARRPGTGSALPSAGQPGVLYIGEVGYFTWEEMDVCTGPGLNFGWPLFEGYSVPASYEAFNPTNQDAVNPLFGIGGCTKRYFTFRDLLKEASLSAPAWPNPCNPAESVPDSIPHFVHTRPVADWMHNNGPARVGIFDGDVASTVNIGAPSSPVSGPQFGGSCSIGGAWYTSTAFPPQFRNTYFHGDLSGGWIKSFTFDSSNHLVSVQNFAQNAGAVVGIAVHPTNGALYYLSWTDTLRKITYTGPNDQPPTAVASSDRRYGAGPLTVQFTGTNSSDPEGLALTYDWDFGDGSAHSAAANPSHTFSSVGGPRRYDVRLTVTDSIGQTSDATVLISVDNTPPVVTILSPTNGSLYSIATQTVVNLSADVTDAEHSHAQLSPEWRVVLHHNDHIHSDPINTNWMTTATLATLGCDGDTYFYRITLVVTDAGGLTNAAFVDVYPNCNRPPTVALVASNVTYTENAAPVRLDPSATFSDPDSANLAGGNLTVSFTAHAADEDRLDVRHEGVEPGQIGRSADVVLYGGTPIGTLSGGSGVVPLVVTFNASATPAAVQGLLRNLTYANVQDLPSVLPRTVQIVADDGDGGLSAPASLEITVVAVPDEPLVTWANPAPLGYGGALGAAQLNATANVPGTFAYTPGAGVVPAAGAGLVLSVKFTPTDTTNYNEHVATVLLEVRPAPLGITADDKTSAHGSLPALTATYVGFTNGDTVASLSTPVELTTTALSNSPPGTYPITVSGGASSNYAVTRINGTLTVLPPAGPVLLWPSNQLYYVHDSGPALLNTNASVTDSDTLLFGGGTLTVSFATNGTPVDGLLLQPDGGEGPGHIGLLAEVILYGTNAVGTWSGGTNGGSLVVLLNEAATLDAVQAIFRRVSFESSASPETPPRTLHALLDDGHGGVSLPAEMTVHVIAPTVAPVLTWPAPEPISYGTALGSNQLNATAGVPGTFNYSPPAGTILRSGLAHLLSVHFVPDDTNNYQHADATVELDVLPAPLLITAENKLKAYGQALPVFTATFTGFIEGESQTNLDSAVTFATSATAATAVGIYPIIPGGATSSNYTIQFIPGNLEIMTVPLTIRAESKAQTYGEPVPPFTFTFSGFVNGDTPSSLTLPPTAHVIGPLPPHVGAYPIMPGGAVSSNYVISYESGELTVSRALLTIRADDKTKAYLAAMPELTASYTGFVNGDTFGVLDAPAVVTTLAEPASPAGGYDITVGGALDADYQISFVKGTLTVTNSVPELRILEVTAGGDVLLQLLGTAGVSVDLEESFDMQAWSALGQFTLAETPTDHRDIGGGLGAQKFYRLKVRQ